MNETTPAEIARALRRQWERNAGPVPPDAEHLMTKLLKRALVDGIKQGVAMYAWWKDGEQYVGTCGKTLRQALADIDADSQECGGDGWEC